MIFMELSQEYYLLGIRSVNEHNLTDAINLLKKAYSLDNNNWIALNVMGMCFYKRGEFNIAKVLWTKSLQVHSKADNQASSYIESLRMEDCSHLIDTYNKALTTAQTGKFSKSIAILSNTSLYCLEYCKFTNLLGSVYMAKGDYPNAMVAFKKTLEADSGDDDAKYYIKENWQDYKFKTTLYYRLKSCFIRG